jgi:ribosomal protein S18 acetylase RimI-like enzyme
MTSGAGNAAGREIRVSRGADVEAFRERVPPNGIRVNAVYTPPRLRGRGYATACVAALSSAQLRAGRRYCFLFTDLANSTANEIYQRIGYVAVGDVDQHEFSSPSGKSSRSRATASQSR